MKQIKKNWPKHLLQWSIILAILGFSLKIFGNDSFDPEAYCPFGGLQTLATYLERGSMACSMTATQIMMGVFLGICVILFSKLFCAYLCPLGWGAEYLGKIRGWLKIKSFNIPHGSIADRALRSIKYILLFWIFYMTISSSELFCKNFDPYYAFATGFTGELTVWMASISIVVFFLLSFIVNMFWCKYICPLGAVSNIFKFTITLAIVYLIYYILTLFGVEFSWIVLLAVVCIIGFIGEIFCREPKYFPLLKIVRDTESCNNCGVCTNKCPYSLDVAKMDVVKHVDCTLCGECIASCKRKSLTISKKRSFRWLPIILTIVLFFTALFIGSKYEIPTIDERWGEGINYEELTTLRVDGMRSITCFGSSKAFAAKLKKMNGIYGVQTYVKDSYVYIKYSPSETSEEKILEEIYVPSKFKINHPPKDVEKMKVITIRTENMHDRMDPNYLGLQIRNTGKKYYGLETEYACPIIVRLYLGIDEPIDEDFYKEMVEMKELKMPVLGGGFRLVEVNFEYVGLESQIDTITRVEFLRSQYKPYKQKYSENLKKWEGKGEVATYEIIYLSLDKPLIARNLPYLSSSLSLTDGVLSMNTLVNDAGDYVIRITFAKDAIDEEKLWEVMTAPKWTVWMKTGEEVEVDAKFKLKEKGKLI